MVHTESHQVQVITSSSIVRSSPLLGGFGLSNLADLEGGFDESYVDTILG